MTSRPQPPQPEQQQDVPGSIFDMQPAPDHGETSYKGSGRLAGKKAIITGGDSGIGRAVAIAYAREGADVLISYQDEHEDAKDTARPVEEAGRTAIPVPGDITEAEHCRHIVQQAVNNFGQIDILVNNAAFQMTRESLDEISDDEFDRTIKTNIYAMFYLCKAAVPHMPSGAAIISTASVNADQPKPKLIAYSATKAAIVNFSGSPRRCWPIKAFVPTSWRRPDLDAADPVDNAAGAGENPGSEVPMQRVGQPAELAPAYVMLASDEASYISGATVAVTGGVAVI